nr:hypothetical protein Q903MT_gene5208 [Picea sitchensis]
MVGFCLDGTRFHSKLRTFGVFPCLRKGFIACSSESKDKRLRTLVTTSFLGVQYREIKGRFFLRNYTLYYRL